MMTKENENLRIHKEVMDYDENETHVELVNLRKLVKINEDKIKKLEKEL